MIEHTAASAAAAAAAETATKPNKQMIAYEAETVAYKLVPAVLRVEQ